MKKLLGIVALSLAIILPMNASAAGYQIAADSSVCSKSCPTADGKCSQTCQIKVINNTTSISTLNVNLTFGDGVSITEVKASDGWENLSGNSNNISLMANTPITASSFVAATVTFDVTNASTDCSIGIEVEGQKNVVEVKQTQQTQTGASLPIAIIAVGACAAIVIYGATRKNKKMYKI